MHQRQELPGWKAMQLAEVLGISKMIMLYDEEIVEPMRSGAAFPNLKEAGFLTSREFLSMLDFGKITPGWREFGMSSSRPESGTNLGRYKTGATSWVLIYEWNPARSAFDAFLEAQDTIRPQRISLTPDFVLPCMFLTRMAYFPLTPQERGPAAQWLSCFAQAQRRLFPLINGLFIAWLRGTSSAAARYRASTGMGHPPFSDDQQQAITRWKNIFGTHLLDEVRTNERIEPTIIRGLETASTQLWSDRDIPIAEKFLGLATALLPIARWQPVPPGPEHLEDQALDTLDTLRQAWEDWRDER